MQQMDLFTHAYIPLYNRHARIVAYTVIDSVDAPKIEPFRWYLSRAGCGYAMRYTWSSKKGRGQIILMHREILDLPRYDDGREGDHKNRYSLDNRRDNLRIVTHAQNLQNRYGSRFGTSRYRGVHWHSKKQRWIAKVKVDGKPYHIGIFLDEESAHTAVVKARLTLLPFSIEPDRVT